MYQYIPHTYIHTYILYILQLTVDGLESQMAVNHLSHFLLTSLLLPYMAENGRIINHSSLAHSFAEKNFVENNLLSEKSYDPFKAYCTYIHTYHIYVIHTYIPYIHILIRAYIYTYIQLECIYTTDNYAYLL